jgi:RNA polymerase sigma-70 factor (sigma-E family)
MEPRDEALRPERVTGAMLRAELAGGEEIGGGRLGEMYQRHADGAVRLAYLLTADRALAEDLVQEAFARLAGRLVHLRDPGAFDAYLRRTVVNLSNSHFRRRRVERAYLERQKAAAGLVARSAGGEPDVDERDALWRSLRRLTERQRAAIVLRYYEDLSEDQVAQILNCRRGTVKSLVARGLEQLRGEIGR